MQYFRTYKLQLFLFIFFAGIGALSALAEPGYETTAPAVSNSDAPYDLFANKKNPGFQANSPVQTDGAGGPTQPVAAATAPNRGFFTRLGHAYLDDWTVDSNGSPAAPEPARRGTPRPLNSPPFPSADWPMGGTVVIGAPDYGSYILMQAINENKSRYQDLRLVRYRWKRQHVEQGPVRQQRNRLRRHPQLHSSLTRLHSTSSACRIPYKRSTSIGDSGSLASTAWTTATPPPKESSASNCCKATITYGYDPVMYYLDFYVPHVGKEWISG